MLLIFLIFGYPSITFSKNQLAIKRINSHGSAKMYQFPKVKKTNLQIDFLARKSKRKCQFSLCIQLNESSILNFVLRSFLFFFYNFRDHDLFKAITAEFITLDTHYKYDRFNDMVELLNVVNKKETVSYL